MPGTFDEQMRLVHAIVDNITAPDFLLGFRWEDGTRPVESDLNELMVYVLYEMRRRRNRANPARRRAMKLLRSLLTPEQRSCLRSSRYFFVQGSGGRTYRLYPYRAIVEQVERHGRHWYGVRTFCYHDPESELPAPDVSIAHLLILTCEEARFLLEANRHERRLLCWDGAYLRRLRAARLAAMSEGD